MAGKVLMKRNNAILIGNDEVVQKLASSVLTTKSAQMQTEYMSSRKIKLSHHKVSIDITHNRLGYYFSKYQLRMSYQSQAIEAKPRKILYSR